MRNQATGSGTRTAMGYVRVPYPPCWPRKASFHTELGRLSGGQFNSRGWNEGDADPQRKVTKRLVAQNEMIKAVLRAVFL